MARTPCCEKNSLKKGPWTQEEDQKLTDYINKHGCGNWRTLPNNAGLRRCGKSCRLRWTNYLRPDIKRGRFSLEEEETIVQLHSILGNKWSAIAARLPGRTDNEIKNYWNTHIRKKLLRMGIDPVTHTPRLDLLNLSSIFYNSRHINNLSQLNNLSQPCLNHELLRFATSIVSAERKNPNLLLDSVFHHESQRQDHQYPIEHVISDFATLNLPFPNVGGFVSDQRQSNEWENNGVSSNLGSDYCQVQSDEVNYENSDPYEQTLFDPTAERSLISNSTYFTSSTEDEIESYCREMLKFDIPNVFGVNEFM